ncbi:MAG: ribbon-helix-helix protein, CopG family [bacterium]
MIGFSVPPEIAREVEDLARKERKTKSELFRRMVQFYRRYAPMSDALELAAIEELIREAQQEPERSDKEEILAFRRLRRYGRQTARRLGIKTEEDVNRLVEEFRAGR